jgi:hypothetical protein
MAMAVRPPRCIRNAAVDTDNHCLERKLFPLPPRCNCRLPEQANCGIPEVDNNAIDLLYHDALTTTRDLQSVLCKVESIILCKIT